MKSVKSIFKIGKGPSSSHTMGPFKSVRHYVNNHTEARKILVTLYGSLAATGKGHLTDWACEDAFRDGKVHIEWQPKENQGKPKAYGSIGSATGRLPFRGKPTGPPQGDATRSVEKKRD